MVYDYTQLIKAVVNERGLWFDSEGKYLRPDSVDVKLALGGDAIQYVLVYGRRGGSTTHGEYFGFLTRNKLSVEVAETNEFTHVDNVLFVYNSFVEAVEKVAQQEFPEFSFVRRRWETLVFPKSDKPVVSTLFRRQDFLVGFFLYAANVYWSKAAQMLVPPEYSLLFVDAAPAEVLAQYMYTRGTYVKCTVDGKAKEAFGPGKLYHKAKSLAQLLMYLNSAVFKVPINYRIPEKYYASYAQKVLGGV